MITPTSNQKNVLKEYLEKALPHFSHFPICIEIITAYCTSFPTRFPYPAINETHRIFWELPPGKVGKNGKVVKQSGQKGNTCAFYAMKRVLRPEQTRTPHHALCSKRRKAITATPDFHSLMLYFQASNPADQAFLKFNNLDPHKAAHDCNLNHFKLLHPEVPEHLIEKILREQEAIVLQKKPWLRFERIAFVAVQTMIAGYGLQTVPCSDLLTTNGLRKTLLKGSLLIAGHFGSAYYFGKEPIKLAEKIGNRQLFGWSKNTPFNGAIGATHMIVLTGIEIKPQNTRVYWIDPVDPSDPNQPETQRIFVHSFETFVSRMTCFAGILLSKLSDQAKQQVPGAYYNPQCTTV